VNPKGGSAAAELADGLFEAGCVKFGSFTLKSGLTSPIYIDLRLLVTHPGVLKAVAGAMAPIAKELSFDRLAAIPYGGLPIGVALSLEMNRPLIYPRREVKEHGTKRAIEGAFEPGETALLVDDLISRGDSKVEAAGRLEAAGLEVHDVLVLVDREQGGAADLAGRGYTLHSVLRLAEMLEALRRSDRITEAQHDEVLSYLQS